MIETQVTEETTSSSRLRVDRAAHEDPESYGLTYSERDGFEVMPYDGHGRPLHRHPLAELTFPSPSAAYAAIRSFEEGRRAA